jgi:hypothetical protein
MYWIMKTNITRFANIALWCVAALLGTTFNAMAQGLVAVNDTLRTGPLQKVRKDIIHNDYIPGDSYEWRIITPLPIPQGTLATSGDSLEFTPNAACRNTAFSIKYELRGSEMRDTAEIRMIVNEYNNPVNMIDSDVECVSEMLVGVAFSPDLKYVAGGNTKWRLDGFSMPLVGDLNRDGKPEIVALGLTDGGGDGLAATGERIIIFNGQTGEQILNYTLYPTLDLRYEPRHNSTSKLAIADLDGVSPAEIILTKPDGSVCCYRPVYDSNGNISTLERPWTNEGTALASTNKGFKIPVNDTGNGVYGAPVPYIADINADGKPEVLVYNKIYDGITGALVCTLETLNNFGYKTDASENTTIHDTYAFTGRRPGATWEEDYTPCMAIADINGDDTLDIVAGSKVYIMGDSVTPAQAHVPALRNIIHGPKSVTAQRGRGSNSTATFTCQVNDGFTAVADIDMDGKLDVIVFAPAESGMDHYTRSLIYVWDPMSSNPATAKAATYLYTSSSSGTFSHPFIGDINGRLDNYAGDKKLPEICMNTGRLYSRGGYYANESPTGDFAGSIITVHPSSNIPGMPENNSSFNIDATSDIRGHVLAFTYHANPDGSTPMSQRLKLSWVMEHRDESASTGITMFDFDNDGVKELCYRDEISLRVISPDGGAQGSSDLITNTYVDTNSPGPIIRFRQPGVRSYTGFEAPVIADVNMDGSADIVTMANDATLDPGNTGLTTASRGYVYVFEHESGKDAWAPCPPVWNQAIYFPLQINEDLTVPAIPQSMLTPYQGANNETIYPYNGQWIQQPIVKQGAKYIPQVRHPDAVITDMAVKVSTVNPNAADVTLWIRNGGSASINAQTPIAFYNGGADGKNIGDPGVNTINVLPVGVDIFPGERTSITYTINNSSTLKDGLVWARIMDDGTSFPATGYHDCILANNTFSGSDCPYLHYTTKADPDTVLCGTDSVRLTAEPREPAHNPPNYQWYRNDVPVTGATSQTCVATQIGTYKCFVIEGICRGFSTPKRLTHTEEAGMPPAPAIEYTTLSLCDSLKLSVAAPNDTWPKYRWYRDGVELPDDTLAFCWAKAPGDYTVTYFEKPCFSKMSDTVTVTFSKPELSSTLTPLPVCSGAAFNYTATSATSSITFSWTRAAVTGITPATGSGSTAVIREPLANTTTRPVEVTYEVKLQGATLTCANTQEVKVWVFPSAAYTMRWTGQKDENWQDPANWVDTVKPPSGGHYESPVSWYPQACTDVVISSNAPHYPELTDTAYCNTITVQDHALLKNPHVLDYRAARVEISLKSTERDRFVMWSAPLHHMYSGDYHFKDAAGQPHWGDVYMNFFQQANPDPGSSSAAASNTFTATFGHPGVSLERGKAFNVKVTGTSLSKDRTWIFPQPDSFYADAAGTRYPTVGNLTRSNSHRFITDGMAIANASDTTYTLELRPTNNYKLVQVVNPYLAWLDMEKFLQGNSSTLDPAGYLIWDGSFGTDFSAVNLDGSHTYINTPTLSPISQNNPTLIPPLQSFFVEKSVTNLNSVLMSPNWTTTTLGYPYVLRAASVENGALRIHAGQGQRNSYTLLRYDMHASAEYRGNEDIRTLFYDELPLTVYSFTPLREPLAINASGSFGQQETALGLRVPEAGTVKLSFSGMETFGHNVYLLDRQTGLRTDLQQTPEYTFTVTGRLVGGSEVIEVNDRLVLQMEYTGNGLVDVSVPRAPAIRCAGLDRHILVQAVSGAIRRLEIYNVAGALVHLDDAGSTTEYRIPVPTGIYLVKVHTGAGSVHTEKVIVR